ncbi:GTP-binding protein [Roseiarcaceae bacterium H3SJ34-1]|uniref:CobW family GTP-binding protein n=1 Tax=Terripilifer ovatus TaxID=3032367 RepID=UPI003AB94214|nr:GTP-binding protein [Roseiarcaceae bacterium H3SJ34-1]
MAQRTRVPILILTGFLGSGKTSLLSKWLRAPEFAGSMVVVNELGEVGLDDRLVQTSSEAPLLLENGCACCAASEDLNATLERLFWERLHRTIPRFSWVLIETTGIADPKPIIAALQAHELIAERYEIAGVVTTFDARRGPAQLLRHPECVSQIVCANAIALTKTDIATDAEIAAARAAIHELRPVARIMPSAKGDLPAAVIVAAVQDAHMDEHICTEECHDHTHHHDHEDHAGHHIHAHHSDHVTSAFTPLPAPIAFEALAAALQATLEAHAASILRVKGTARCEPDGAIEVVQTMPREPIERQALGSEMQDPKMRVGMTFIVQETAADIVAGDFAARLGISISVPAQPIEARPHG